MPISMQGSWTVKVKKKLAAYKQRFRIQGSTNADGVYEGELSTPAVSVTGAQWTIAIEHKPTGSTSWLQSDERLTDPTASGSQFVFDIQSNDTGQDTDYNDLVLSCSATKTDSEFVVYGRVRTYKGYCKVNPCFPYYVVIDTRAQLVELLKDRVARKVIQAVYPERFKKYVEQPPFKRRLPEPDPPPFRPMMIPLGQPPEESEPLPARAKAREPENSPNPGNTAPKAGGTAVGYGIYDKVAEYAFDLARIKDRVRAFCVVKDQPGLLLRFLEYDRTAEELVGGPYTGEGHRQILGLTVTDEQGRYIFRFTRTLEDVAAEVSDIVPSGPPVATQLRPDILVQIVSGMGDVAGVLFETALYADIPNLKRIDICIPESEIKPGLTACQGGRAIQAIGNIWTISGVGNTLDAAGRITATHSAGPQITRGAWVGTLDLFACFVDLPAVKHYTIRYRRPGGAWQFVQQNYRHIYIPRIGDPNHPDHKVGPFQRQLVVDGTGQTVPAYKNIELDPDWIMTHRLRKAQLWSWVYENALYALEDNVRTVEFKIEGYDDGVPGNRVPGAEDTIKLFIDNRAIEGDIESVSMGIVSPGECAFFELPTANEPLTVKFRVRHPAGFLKQYWLSVYRGSNTSVAVADNQMPLQPLSLLYDEPTHGNHFFGTFNAVSPDSQDYVLAVLQPTLGSWLAGLPPEKTFCAFAFEIHALPRTTDGYGLSVSRELDKELVGISYNPV